MHNIKEGTDVKVHMNLHKRRHGHLDQWSVLDAKTGKLLATVETITLTEARPIASTAKKYQDILKDGKRRVVADIRGTVTLVQPENIELYEEVHYDPMRAPHFTYEGSVLCNTKYEGSTVAYFPPDTSHFLAY